MKLSNLLSIDVIKKHLLNLTSNKEFIVFRNFSFGSVINYFVLYIITIFLNKNLSVQNLGAFSYYTNILFLIYPLLSLNIYQVYLRFINKTNNRLLIKKVVWVSILGTILMFILTYLIWHNLKLSTISFIILFQERTYYFRSSVNIKIFNLLTIGASTLLLITISVLIYLDVLTYSNAICAYGTTYLLISIIGYILPNKKIVFKIEEELKLNYLLKYSVPLVATTLVTWILTVSDQYIIEHLYTFKEVGEYAIANRVINLLRMITGMFLLYWPILYFEEMRKMNFIKVNKIRWSFLLLIIIIGVGSIIGSKLIYFLVGASKYLNYIVYFKILVLAEIFRVIASILMIYRSFTVQTYYNLIALTIVASLNVILNLIFIPVYGVIFAAVSTAIATFFYLIISILYSFIPEYKYIILKKSNGKINS